MSIHTQAPLPSIYQPKPPLRGQVIAWESMTPRQQAEHLVHGHGYDADWYIDAEGKLIFGDNELVVLAWTGDYEVAEERDDGSEQPYPGGRDHEHATDHARIAEGETDLLRFVHTHDKENR